MYLTSLTVICGKHDNDDQPWRWCLSTLL